MQEYFLTLGNRALASIPNLLTALAILIVSLYLAGFLGGMVRKLLDRRKIAPGITNLLSQILRWTIIVFGVITALQRFFDVTAFLAGLGIVGFTVGFALQNVMQNFAAGIILLIQQPFKEGDAVSVAGFDGTVVAIDLRTTEIITFDGRVVILPNANVLSQAIINFTRANRRRIELPVGVAYGSDTEKVRRAVLDAVQTATGFVAEPAPLAVFHTFSGSSIDLTAYFWIDTKLATPFTAKDSALTKIKEAFEQQSVEIPTPIQTVRLYSES